MIVKERRDRIITALGPDGAASVKELANALNVSESTIRRDLEVLDRNGELVRTYGGAVLKPRQTVEEATPSSEEPFDDVTDRDLKMRVATAAADLVPEGSVVLLDIGSTTPFLAQHLTGRDVTVITSSLAVFDVLRDDNSVRVVLLGGVVRRNYRTLVGSLTEESLKHVSADIVFLTCTGVRANGHVVDNMAIEAPIKESMIGAADKVVLLASEAKFPGTGALRLCSLSDVDVLVTTGGAPPETTALCVDAGGDVLVV